MYTQKIYERKSVAINKALFFLFYAALASWASYFYVFLEEERGLTGTQIGIIAAIQQLNNIIFLPLWGMVSDKFGRKKVFLILLGIVVFLLYGFIVDGSFIYYILFIIVFAALHNPIVPLIDSFAIDKSKEVHVKKATYGHMRYWGSIGWAVSTFITGYIVKGNSYEIIFYIASSILAVVWIIAYFNLNNKREIKSTQKPSFKTITNLLFTNKNLLYFFIFIMIYNLINSPTLGFVNLYYKEIGGSSVHIGTAFAVQALFEIPLMLFGKRILTRFGIRRVLIMVMATAFIRLYLYSLITNPNIAIVLGSLHGITLGLYLITITEYVHHIIPASQNSTGQTLVYTFLGIGTSIGNYFNGFLKDIIGLRVAMGYDSILMLILLVTTAFFLFYKKDKRKIVPKSKL